MKPLAAVICLLLLAGCSRTPPYQQPVEADTPLSLVMWRSKNSDTLTRKEWSLFDQAIEELKLKIMMDGHASGSDAIDQALRTKIDGVKLCDVMLSGLQIRLRRIQTTKTILEESLAANSRLKLRPGDEEKAQALAEKVKQQSERLAKMKETVAEAEADLHQLEVKFKQSPAAPRSSTMENPEGPTTKKP